MITCVAKHPRVFSFFYFFFFCFSQYPQTPSLRMELQLIDSRKVPKEIDDNILSTKTKKEGVDVISRIYKYFSLRRECHVEYPN